MIRFDRAVTLGRLVAIALTLVMAVYFVTSDAIRPGNPFLVPDLLLSAFLLAAALTPRGWVAPAMTVAFTFAAAVWTVSLSSYVVRGAFVDGADHIALITPAVLMTVLLVTSVRHRVGRRGPRRYPGSLDGPGEPGDRRAG